MITSGPTRGTEPAPAAYAYPLIIKQLLHTPLVTAPEQEIVYRDIRRHSYSTMRQRVGQLAGALTSLGVQFGDTVAVMDWDSHRYLESYFAIPMMGAVLMMVNVRLSPDQILYTLNHSGATVLLVNTEFLTTIDCIRDKLETVREFVLISDGDPAELPTGFSGEYETLLSAASPDHVFPDFDENTQATMFYTTGTTGLPKGVFFSHRQLVLHTLSLMAALGTATQQGRISRDDTYMPITPMFHVHAWGLPYVATVMGLKQVYPGRYAPDALIGLVRREKVSFSHCVPTILHMILSHPDARDVDLRGWKVIIGGSALPKGLAQAALDRGIDVLGGYGMSETCPVLTLAQIKTPLMGDADRELDIRTKAGIPIPLVDLRVIDEAFGDLPHDGKAAGEVVVRAPWLTQGYFRNPPASEELWAGGYLHTNDIGVIDSEGYLLITDRIKDVIKTGGEWISSLGLEDVISQHPAVSEVAVIGIKDAKWGERPLVLIVLRPDYVEGCDKAAIQRHVKAFVDQGQISRFAIPDKVLFVDAIERTSVGKLNKRGLREKYQYVE